MNDMEIGILILAILCALFYCSLLYFSYKYDDIRKKQKKTSISIDDAQLIMDFIQWSHLHKELDQSLNPLAIELYIKCHNIKKYYESEKK